MNADRLLHAFSLIGEAPARVQQLRQVVVALAIAEKLGSASDALSPDGLLREVENVKADLYRQRSIPKPKSFKPVERGDLPESFPDARRFARLGSVARVEKGLTGIKQAQPGPFPLVVTGAERATADHFDFEGAAAIIPLVSSTGHGNASLNRLHYQEGRFALGTILAAVFPYDPALISARFIFEYLSTFKDELLVARMTGTANVTLSMGRIEEVPVPLVSPSTQEKVDELMTLLDELEAVRTAREATRDRLTAVSLAGLRACNADSPNWLENAKFALTKLPALTARAAQVKSLRQTILSLAVRGKLAAQDPTDEPALDYLLRLDELPSKTRKQLKPLDASDCGGDLPKSWTWLPLGSIIRGMDAGWSPQCENHPRSNEDEWGVLRTTSVQSLAFQPIQNKLLPAKLKPRPDFQVAVGDILVTRAGPKNRVGISCVVDVPCPRLMISDKLIRFHPLGKLSSSYIALTLNAGYTLEQVEAAKSGMAVMQMNISQNKLRAVPIPLPPLAEQLRIVAKVDALMALCDRLEAALAAADSSRARLLEALLREALMPAPMAQAA